MMENANGMMYMPVAPAYNAGGYTNDGSMFGGNWMWFLLVWMAMFGWGGNGFGFGGNGGYSDIQRGFDQNAIMTGIQGLQTGLTNGFAQAEISANSRQMADMNQNFAIQQGISNLQYAVSTEACADRNALSNALQQVMTQNNNNTQRLLDTMCQDKIDAKNELIANLRQQLQMAQMSASQNAQTAAIIANNEAQTTALEKYLAPTPVPAYTVPNPSCCNQTFGCPCGNA